MEQVSQNVNIIDHFDGRTLNPGHAIEGAWFILHEAKYRNNDPHLINLGCRMIDLHVGAGFGQRIRRHIILSGCLWEASTGILA